MTYHAKVQNGALMLDAPIQLPDGMEVEVEVRPVDTANAPPPSLLERLKDVVGIVKDQPPDSGRNLDHYLYGAQKR